MANQLPNQAAARASGRRFAGSTSIPRSRSEGAGNDASVITEPELCKLLGIHRNTAAAWRRRGVLVPVAGGRPYRYSARRVIAMIDDGVPMGRRPAETDGDDLSRRAAADYARLRRVQSLLRQRGRREDRDSRGRASHARGERTC